MGEKVISLSVDEMGMSFILINEDEVAKRYLVSSLGAVDEAEVRGRLFAAHDTLVAREFAIWSEKEQRVVLIKELESIIAAMAKPRMTILATAVIGDTGSTFAYHFKDELIAEVKDKGIAGQDLRSLDDPEEVVSRISSLMDYPAKPAVEEYRATVSYEQISEARRLAGTDPDAVAGFFKSIGVDEKTAEVLTSDFLREEMHGSILRLDYDGETARGDRGLLILKSPDRGWVFKLFGDENNPMLDCFTTSKEGLDKELRDLLS